MPIEPRPSPEILLERGKNIPVGAALSVVVMAINGDPWVADAVSSLLAQNIGLEIVVVNSGKGSVHEMLAAFADRIVLVESKRLLLPGGTRNLGIAQCTAEIIGFLAADCTASKNWARLRLATHGQGALAVASALRPAPNSNGRVPSVAWAYYALLHVRRAPEFPVEEVALYGGSYHRSLFDRHGFFRDDFRIGEDTDFNARIGAEAGLVWVPEIITYHRYPTSVPGALRDAFHRGRRLFGWQRANNPTPLIASLKRVAGSWLTARRLAGYTVGETRRSLQRTGGYLFLLTASFAFGATFAAIFSLFSGKPPPGAFPGPS